jgi:hypothetical protein
MTVAAHYRARTRTRVSLPRPHGRVQHRSSRRASVARRVRRTARAPGRSGDDDSSSDLARPVASRGRG